MISPFDIETQFESLENDLFSTREKLAELNDEYDILVEKNELLEVELKRLRSKLFNISNLLIRG